MAATRPVRPKPLDWPGPSHLDVFIRSLKLLHLDQREDWPGISLPTLSPTPQNQRNRIRLIEWALYHLYAIWDPESAHNKLRPFFPPLEPLQSVNLRAALFRCLGELKKNGDLGREIVLRKTMLDDCKGDKFEELLASFSAAVLRKVVAVSANEMVWNPAMRLSTTSAMTPTDYRTLLPLILAHQASLGSVGERHARVQEAYDRFSKLLDDKGVELTERADQGSGGRMNDMQSDPEMVRELQTNWLGSEEWAAALLQGGSQSTADAFLELPFSAAWMQAKNSNVDSYSSGLKQDLVLDLEARVLAQRSRLHKWHEYNKSLSKERGTDETSTASAKEPRVLFRDHQSLTIASISKAVRQPGDRGRTLKGPDKYLLSSVNEALSRINGKSRVKPAGFTPEVRKSSKLQFRSLSEIVSSPSTVAEDYHTPGHSPDLETTGLRSEPETEPEPKPHPESESEHIQRSPPTVRLSPDLASSDEEPAPEPIKRSDTLAERTRRSMSLLPPVAHEAPRRRRRPRPSFPVNQFITPRKASTHSAHSRDDISRASTPQDRLFEEDAEYASVFKSRPRVALSPISSPAVHVGPSSEEDSFDLDYYDDGDESEDFEWGHIDSPLAAPRLRR
ncbi:hypothetical protein DTO006G1_6465 [Penicillium roqueforti]|uniref:uncharacterized protein n=1 Tax=Penicillium roqueforti TaxID=5082 RepID=UPI00190D8B01|nr:uncharacterized protein LCP9604111_8102 [Penicillium roqueforti]KAF9242194.1 hypothetical protein LCP9604111_8102 [Penicillium roqueforti]KAI1833360.1 hypothetical protein CBS147337_5858 [Penicillium roqueforti]KAI2671848.1 hypothetical protein CBS147355_8491 [Penicillium roqueforti]KAI2675205.1 hypothetical protein LCP963914a_8608 [Penicillium roqueforti]KAI2697568.1 hypothetical protein CBS147372_7609 [Penicillium roqueforti]